MLQTQGILRGHSCAKDARDAVRELHEQIAQARMELVVFFCSSAYDLDALAVEIGSRFAGVQVVGCTTAGEIGPAGYCDYSVSGASFPTDGFSIVAGAIEGLRTFDTGIGQNLAQHLLQRLEHRAPHLSTQDSFAFLLIDGLSVREEPVTRALQSAFSDLPLVGGSAGDGLEFRRTHVYFDGAFRNDSAVVVLGATRAPFRIFKTQHFVTVNRRVVVTSADPATRLVREIDGRLAAEVYAELVGVDVGNLDPMRFAAAPMVVVIDGTNYVRSIQRANPDRSLTFFCAIESGLVLRVARGENLLGNLEETFAGLRADIGEPQLVLACDCILRKLEIAQSTDRERVVNLLRENRTVGFNTYGEQYHGVHVNQTLTGIAFGASANGELHG